MHLQSEPMGTTSLDARPAGRRGRWLWLVGAVVLAVAITVSAGLGFTLSHTSWSWVLGAVLGVVILATVVVCVHAGGHAFLAPLPAVAVAAAWALLASSRHLTLTAAWSLAGASAALAGGAAVLAGAAVAQRNGGHLTLAHPLRDGAHLLRGDANPLHGADGVAITALTPIGVVRVAGETWSGESLSGPLPAGAAVHVVAVRGLRLQVWSEAGTVPGLEELDSEGNPQ